MNIHDAYKVTQALSESIDTIELLHITEKLNFLFRGEFEWWIDDTGENTPTGSEWKGDNGVYVREWKWGKM